MKSVVPIAVVAKLSRYPPPSDQRLQVRDWRFQPVHAALLQEDPETEQDSSPSRR